MIVLFEVAATLLFLRMAEADKINNDLSERITLIVPWESIKQQLRIAHKRSAAIGRPGRRVDSACPHKIRNHP